MGRAFHSGLEAWWTVDGSPGERLIAAHQNFAAQAADLSWEDRVLGPELLTGYAAMYGSDELRFHAVPIAERKVILPVLHPESGEPDADLTYTVVFDTLGYDAEGRTVLVEHKGTASDISTQKFWRRFDTSLQLPLQVLAAIDSGREPHKLVLDAVRTPVMHRMRATPIEKREFYVRDSKWGKSGDAKPGTRTRDESREEFEERVRESLLDDPNKFYLRRDYFFDEYSLRMARLDLWDIGQQMLGVAQRMSAARNPDGCEKYNSMCGFEGACWRGESLADTQLYTVRTKA
jgi:hypothetical protein